MLKPVWEFRPHGQSGKMLGEVVAPIGAVVDEMAFVHNVVGKTGVHSQGTLLRTTGFDRPEFPGMGCWVSYGPGDDFGYKPADRKNPTRGYDIHATILHLLGLDP